MQGEKQCILKCVVPNHVVFVFRYLGWEAELLSWHSYTQSVEIAYRKV